jgi:hypothetical protein
MTSYLPFFLLFSVISQVSVLSSQLELDKLLTVNLNKLNIDKVISNTETYFCIFTAFEINKVNVVFEQ